MVSIWRIAMLVFLKKLINFLFNYQVFSSQKLKTKAKSKSNKKSIKKKKNPNDVLSNCVLTENIQPVIKELELTLNRPEYIVNGYTRSIKGILAFAKNNSSITKKQYNALKNHIDYSKGFKSEPKAKVIDIFPEKKKTQKKTKPRIQKKWQKHEEDFLQHSYGIMSISDIAKYLNRSYKSVHSRAERLKLNKNKTKRDELLHA
jgi:hypothetical protein